MVPSAPTSPAPGASDEAVEIAFWNSIGSSTDPRLYREYLAKYPQGKFASIARLKLQEPPPKAADTARPPAPTPPQPEPAQAAPSPQANLPPFRPALKPDEYSGPLRGNLVWTGSLNPGDTLTIQGGQAIAGNLLGHLPRVPVTVDLVAARGAKIIEPPSAANQFDRIVVRNSSARLIQSLVIRWRLAK